MLARLASIGAVTVADVGLIVAQANDGDGSTIGDFAILFNYGVLGIVTLLWLTGRIKTGADVEKAEARAIAAEAERRELANVLRTDVVPAMVKFTEAGQRILDRASSGGPT